MAGTKLGEVFPATAGTFFQQRQGFLSVHLHVISLERSLQLLQGSLLQQGHSWDCTRVALMVRSSLLPLAALFLGETDMWATDFKAECVRCFYLANFHSGSVVSVFWLTHNF